ncbi:hypothetical protein LINPERHAP2_LOCUS11744 [Linum perenne]
MWLLGNKLELCEDTVVLINFSIVGLYDSVVESKEFIRGFVRIDVTQPLLGRRKARYSHGGEFWVNFGYEGLPTVCFGCGLLGHPLRLCSSPFADGTDSEDRGPWMRVEKMTYHQVKSAGKKRSAADSGSGEGLTSAAEVAGSSKLPQSEVGPKGLVMVQAQLGNPQALVVDPHVHEGPSAAPIGFGQHVMGQSSVLAQGADSDMVDAISESVNFLLDQPALPEVPPLHLTLLSELSNLYITNPSGSFDNGLPIDVQVGRVIVDVLAMTSDITKGSSVVRFLFAVLSRYMKSRLMITKNKSEKHDSTAHVGMEGNNDVKKNAKK